MKALSRKMAVGAVAILGISLAPMVYADAGGEHGKESHGHEMHARMGGGHGGHGGMSHDEHAAHKEQMQNATPEQRQTLMETKRAERQKQPGGQQTAPKP